MRCHTLDTHEGSLVTALLVGRTPSSFRRRQGNARLPFIARRRYSVKTPQQHRHLQGMLRLAAIGDRHGGGVCGWRRHGPGVPAAAPADGGLHPRLQRLPPAAGQTPPALPGQPRVPHQLPGGRHHGRPAGGRSSAVRIEAALARCSNVWFPVLPVPNANALRDAFATCALA